MALNPNRRFKAAPLAKAMRIQSAISQREKSIKSLSDYIKANRRSESVHAEEEELRLHEARVRKLSELHKKAFKEFKQSEAKN